MGMPIYEFRCDGCGARFEELVPLDGRVERCPQCGAERPGRVLAPPGPALHLVRTPGETRKQEWKNANLRETTRTRFKEARKAAARRTGDA